MMMTDLTNIGIILPSLDPDEKLRGVLEGLLEVGFRDILLINDGSKPENRHYFTDAAAAHPEITLLHHEVNRGKGAALKTAIAYYLANRPEGIGVVTVDGDGQHHKLDILACAESMAHSGEITLGVRDFDQPDVPWRSRFGNKITCGIFKFLVGMDVSDTQTGLRGFSSELLPVMIAVKGDRYEYEMNMLIECARRHLPMRPLPIQTVYENNNEGSHFRAVRDSARIYSVILAGFFKFISASLLSFVVDYALYLLLNLLLKNVPALTGEVNVLFLRFVPHITIATVGARILSGLFNFTINRKFVFADRNKVSRSFPRYLAVFLLNMILSAALTSGLHLWLGWSENLVKIPVDILLFILSYKLQQNWVFAPDQKKTTEA
jgi:putative flippase GtrA